MPNTYTQIYIQFIFAVKYRASLLKSEWDERLRLYMTAIAQNNGHKIYAINNVSDHLHLLVGLNPNQSPADLMRILKSDSSEWINKEKLTPQKFYWQEGYGAFSYSKSQTDAVVRYIQNQPEHHQKLTFLDEYRQMLEKSGLDFDEKYIFKLPE